MSRVTDEMLIMYLARQLSPEDAHDLESELARDAELAAKLQLIEDFSGLRISNVRRGWRKSFVPFRSLVAAVRETFQHHPVWISVALIVIGAGVTGASLNLLFHAPLLQDDFNDNWFDSRIWLPPPLHGKNQGVRETDGHLKLVNRGFLISKQEFNEPIDVSFDWRFSELGLNPVYADHLAVMVRSSGQANPVYPFEIEDGVRIHFNAWTGVVALVEESGKQLVTTVPGAVKMAAETWYHIRITDDGERVVVYLNEGKGNARRDAKPVIEGLFPKSNRSGHLVFYNRELVGGIPHESFIDDIVVQALQIRE